MDLKGRHRRITGVPHAANKHTMLPTGLSFDGVQVVLLVPSNAEKQPHEYVFEFCRDFHRMHKRSKMTTLHDMYEETFRMLMEQKCNYVESPLDETTERGASRTACLRQRRRFIGGEDG